MPDNKPLSARRGHPASPCGARTAGAPAGTGLRQRFMAERLPGGRREGKNEGQVAQNALYDGAVVATMHVPRGAPHPRYPVRAATVGTPMNSRQRRIYRPGRPPGSAEWPQDVQPAGLRLTADGHAARTRRAAAPSRSKDKIRDAAACCGLTPKGIFDGDRRVIRNYELLAARSRRRTGGDAATGSFSRTTGAASRLVRICSAQKGSVPAGIRSA